MPEADLELKSAVKNAKGKRSYFVFIQKSATDGTLLVGKSKPPDKEVAEAKKKRGGSTTIKGACFGEGERLVFEMSGDPPPNLEDALNKVIKRDAGVTVNALCRRGNSPDLVEGTQEGEQSAQAPVEPVVEPNVSPDNAKTNASSGPVPPPQPVQSQQPVAPRQPVKPKQPVQPQQNAEPNKGDAYYEKRKPLGERLKAALKIGRPDAPKLKEVFGFSEGAAKKQEFAKGVQGLDALAKLLANANPVAPAQSNEQRKQYFQRRKPLEPLLVDFLKAKPANAAQLATTFKIAEHRAKNEEFPTAMQALEVVEKLLRNSNGAATPDQEPTNYTTVVDNSADIENLNRQQPVAPEETVEPVDNSSENHSGEVQYAEVVGGAEPPENRVRDPVESPRSSNLPPEYSEVTENVDGNSDDESQSSDVDYTLVANPTGADPNEPEVGAELDALLDKNMDPVQLQAERALTVQKINSDWANSIDLTNAKVSFSNAPQGAFGKLGFIDTGDPNCPRLAMKVPLAEKTSQELQHEVDQYEKCRDKPNIAKCMGIVEVDGHRGMVMEAIDGDNMSNTMDAIQNAYKNGNLSNEEFWGLQTFMMRETLKGLAQLEEAGIVHNDIRSDNLMIDKNTGDVKVIDFGVSTVEGGRVKQVPSHKGTASPDVLTGAPLTAKHDAFSVGAVTYEAGEQQPFDYNQPGADKNMERFKAFAAFAPPDQKAIRKYDADNPAFTTDSEGTASKEPGRYGAETEYTKFVNIMMDADPKKRLSPAEALQHKFLNEAQMDDDDARELLKKFMTTGSNPDRPTNPDVIPKRNPPPKVGQPGDYNLSDV